jgi:YVTN family beta-propeller protein
MPRSLRPFLIALTLLLGGLFLSSSAVLAAPQINNQINYQARLMDSSGFPVADGNYSVYLSLYDASTAGTRLWTATGTLATPTPLTVNVQNGLFTVLLGDTSAAGGSQNTLDTVNWNSDQLYLGVTINADAEMSPRKRFASAPQAFNARQLQGMYASSTASGGQTLFTLNQTQNDAATGTRSTLDVRSNGTSNANDFLIRGINDTGSTVFSINRQGSVTSTNIFVSGLTSSTNLNANIASFATATVAGQGICLSNGQFCSTGSTPEADTLQTVSNRGSFTTTTLTLFGGLTTSNITATGTLNVTGASTLAGVTFTNATATSVTSTNVFGVNGAFTNLTVDSLGVVGITWTNATGTNTTSTNLFASNLLFSNATGGTLLATTVSATNLTVTGQLVCLADGTNCPSGTSPNLQTVTNAGNTTTNAIQFAGGTSTGIFVFNATATVSGALVSLSVTTTDLFANNASFATATVSGQAVCLANGVGCPIGTVLNDTLQSVTARGSFTTTTAQFFGGFVAASSSVTGTLNVAGSANLLQNAYVGTSTYSGGLNSLFAADGNDLFVAGSIGSVSSIYTNGSFVAGSSSTIYADGSITKTNGILEIQAFSSLTGDYGDLGLRAGDGIVGLEDGGAAFMTAGDGASGGDGGWAQVFAGNSGTSSGDLAGTAALVGGSGVGLGDGGDVLLQSGGANNGVAGDIQLNAGSDSTGFDQSGSIYLRPGISSAASSLNDAATFVMIQDANNTDITAQLRFGELAGSNDDFVGFRAANILTTSTVWILPQFSGASGTVVATDGNNQLYFSSVCLTDGTNCPASSGLDTLQSVTARGSFTTTTAQFFGGFVAASSSVTGTFVVVGSTSLRNVDFTTATGTSVTTTNLFATLGSFTTATATNANINILSAATGTVSNLNFRNATGTFLFASTGTFATVTSSFLYANTANFATATVSGVGICLSNGVGCPASGSSNDTLQSVTARGSFTTTTAQFFGGFVAASSSVTGTFAVVGTSTLLRDVYVGTSTYDVFLNSDFVLDGNDLFAADNIGSVSSIFSNGMLVTGETGPTLFGDGFINQTDGALVISADSAFLTQPSISIIAGDVTSGLAGDVNILAGNGLGGNPAGNIYLTPGDSLGQPGHLYLNAAGASNQPQFRFESIGGGMVSLEAPNTANTENFVLPFADGASSTVIGTNGFGGLTFVSVCLTDGTNCPASSGVADLNWTFNLAGDFARNATATTDIAIGSSTLGNAPFVFLNNTTTSRFLIGQNSSTGAGADLVIGATTASGMNTAFQLTGDDLFVAGNIGSASSVYTNGAFIAGPGSTHYGNGYINKNDGSLTLSASLGIVASSRLDARYLNRWFLSPLLKTAVNGGKSVRVPVGNSPTSAAFDGSHMWVVNAASNNVSKIDITTNTVVATTTVGTNPVDIAFDGTYMWVVNQSFGNVSKIDITTNTVVATTTVGAGPNAVAFDGTHVWVANTGSNNVSKIDITTNTVVATTTVGAGPSGIAFDGTHMWVANTTSANANKIEIVSNTVVATTTVGTGALGIAFDGSHMWVANQTQDTISKIDITTNTVVATMTGTSPNSLAFDGIYMWVTKGIAADVIKIDVNTNAAVVVTSTGLLAPNGIAFDGTHMWVTNGGNNNVIKLPVGGGNGADMNFGVNLVPTSNDTFDLGTSALEFRNGFFSGTVSTTNVTVGGFNVCLSNGTNCPASGTETLLTVSNRGALATSTLTLFGGFVAASSSVTGTLSVGGALNVTGTVNILLPSTSTPFYIDAPAPTDFELSQLLSISTTGSEGFLIGNFNLFGSVNATLLNFTKDLNDPVNAAGSRISYYNEFNQMSFGVNASGSNATVLELTDNDSMSSSFGAEAAMTIRKYTDTRTSSMIHLWNLGSNSGEVTVNVGSSDPNDVVNAQIGSIYFRQNSTASGTQAYLNKGSATSWYGIATLDMLPSSSTFSQTRTFLANRTTSTLAEPSNFTMTIGYSSATTFGGLCIDDTFSGTGCPTTNINGASIMADGPILANAFDIAEFYSVTGTADAGDVLVLDASSTATVKQSGGVAYDSKVIGVVSTAPGFVLGWSGGTRVALAGRVPVKVSMNNGPIQVGDALVSSDVPGYAMKATRPGMVLGYALESASATGTAELFVNVGYWAGMALASDGSIQVDDSGNVSVMNDLHVGGRLFPSLRGGGIQNQWYLFVNADDPTSTYISTNADGFQSMDTYDFAERYYSPDELEPGDLVVVSDHGRTHVQRSLNEDDMLLGIVSTRPAFIAGRPATSTYPIALSGRVPTKVSSMNGAIKAGDPLAPTSIPGVAAKAVRSGPVVGLALEDFDGAEISKIEVFVNPNYWVNEQEVAEQEDPEVSSEIVVSQGKQGFATISAGAKKVRIEFPTLNAYPNVQVTPRGSTGGAWWTDDYSDSGFEIIMQETRIMTSCLPGA